MNVLRAFTAGCAILVLAACSSTGVSKRQAYEGDQLARPDRILVHDFTANPADVPSESAFAVEQAVATTQPTAEQLALTDRLGTEVAKRVVEKMQDAGLPAVQASGQPAPQNEDIVIRGYFASAQEGSAAQRVLVGFGSGDAELITAVEAYQMTSEGLRLLGGGEIKSGGSDMPGLILPAAVVAATANPIGLVVGGAVKVAGEVDGLGTIDKAAEETADEIAEQLIEAAKKQGWI